MEVFVTIRTNQNDGPYLTLTESQVREFHDKIVVMRGYPVKRTPTCGAYAGIMLMGKGERWKICRETVSLLNEEKEEIFFVDKDRELERWIIELAKPHLDANSVTMINYDLDEILLFNDAY